MIPLRLASLLLAAGILAACGTTSGQDPVSTGFGYMEFRRGEAGQIDAQARVERITRAQRAAAVTSDHVLAGEPIETALQAVFDRLPDYALCEVTTTVGAETLYDGFCSAPDSLPICFGSGFAQCSGMVRPSDRSAVVLEFMGTTPETTATEAGLLFAHVWTDAGGPVRASFYLYDLSLGEDGWTIDGAQNLQGWTPVNLD